MGRIATKGLGYFSLDTTWETNAKLVKAKYGMLKGAGFLLELWSSVYRENYYREWNEENELLFAGEIQEPVAWVHEVMEYCFDKKIFDRAVFDAFHVLTSHGIQKRYFKIARDSLHRTSIDYIEGITYPDFMPENNLQGKADNLGGNRENQGGKYDKGRGGDLKELNLRREEEEPPALVDNSPEYEEALFRFTLAALVARKKKPGDPESMARAIMHEPDREAAFRSAFKNLFPKTEIKPEKDPPPVCPGCGKPAHRISMTEAGCTPCWKSWTLVEGQGWVEDERPAATGDEFEELPEAGVG